MIYCAHRYIHDYVVCCTTSLPSGPLWLGTEVLTSYEYMLPLLERPERLSWYYEEMTL